MPSSETRWSIVAVAIATGMVAAMQIGKVPPALPLLREEFGLGLVAAGLAASLITATGAVLATATGVVADRLGRRRLLLGGLAALAAGSLGGGLAGSAAALLAARALEGIGFVAVVVSAPAIIAAVTGRDRQRLVLGLWSTYMPVGIAVMMALTPAALAGLGWRGLWLAQAALLAAMLPLTAGITASLAPAAAAPARWGDLGRALKRPGPWLLAASFATYTVQWFAVMSWLPTLLIERFSSSLAAAALAVAAVVALNAPGNLCGGWLLHRGVPRWRLLVVTQACMAVLGLGIFRGVLPETGQLAAALAFSFIGGMLPAATLAGAPLHARGPGQLGAINGVIVQGANLGSVIGPPALAAMVGWAGGWAPAAWLLTAASLLGIVLALGVRRAERRL